MSAPAQAKAFGCDAISAYAIFGGSKAGTPFAASRRKAEAFWNPCKATGTPVVPIVSFAWDRRPPGAPYGIIRPQDTG